MLHYADAGAAAPTAAWRQRSCPPHVLQVRIFLPYTKHSPPSPLTYLPLITSALQVQRQLRQVQSQRSSATVWPAPANDGTQYDDCVGRILSTDPARFPVEASQRTWCIYFAISGLHRVVQTKSRPALTDKLKFDLACSQAWRCHYCTSLLPVAFQVDHFIEWQFGGVHEAANLKATCATCHSEKNRLVTMAQHVKNDAVQATLRSGFRLHVEAVPNP